MISVDFKSADCKWRPGKPDELVVVPKAIDGRSLTSKLRRALRNGRQVTPEQVAVNTKYNVMSERDGVFILTSARRVK